MAELSHNLLLALIGSQEAFKTPETEFTRNYVDFYQSLHPKVPSRELHSAMDIISTVLGNSFAKHHGRVPTVDFLAAAIPLPEFSKLEEALTNLISMFNKLNDSDMPSLDDDEVIGDDDPDNNSPCPPTLKDTTSIAERDQNTKRTSEGESTDSEESRTKTTDLSKIKGNKKDRPTNDERSTGPTYEGKDKGKVSKCASSGSSGTTDKERARSNAFESPGSHRPDDIRTKPAKVESQPPGKTTNFPSKTPPHFKPIPPARIEKTAPVQHPGHQQNISGRKTDDAGETSFTMKDMTLLNELNNRMKAVEESLERLTAAVRSNQTLTLVNNKLDQIVNTVTLLQSSVSASNMINQNITGRDKLIEDSKVKPLASTSFSTVSEPKRDTEIIDYSSLGQF
ncbi:MAG: hypothetical protein SISXV1_gp2 [Sanya Ischnura senegalensis xinmovirus 1]|uniref:Uncharacterized protein n=1 Tax=Sanya Ischnura senegalensis xinmovirus 1 TaxID=2905558 RepID=A0A8K1XGG3_9MONO|nr:MAG: hypothetical protein SISXV1_gp2 [Sanya Ischnura senegalensis xinmovirus 1]